MSFINDNPQVMRTVQATIVGLALPILFLPFCAITKTILSLIVFFLVTGSRPYWIYITVITIPRDLRLIKVMIKIGYWMWKLEKNNETVPKLFMKLVKKHPDKIIYNTEDGDWTFKMLESYAARFAASLPQDVVVRGNPVGLALGQKAGPRLIGAWLGLAQRGVPSALLPPAARQTVLKHAILAAKTKIVVFCDELAEAVSEIQDDPELEDVRLFQYNKDNKNMPVLKNTTLINPEDETLSSVPIYDEIMKGTIMDQLIYIYTSGTTGLPKAAIITNMRYMLIVTAAKSVLNADPDKDKFYTPLPLHHTAGGILGIGQSLCYGIPVAQRNKFSATNYWTDCAKYNCTIAQYIGEVCRFLLVANEKTGATVPNHNIRIMFGNGLRASIWNQFKTTFKLPAIYEFYGATEGNTNMINFMSREGAIGFYPRFSSAFAPISIIKCHQTTGEPFRDSRGLCTKCKPGEAGLLIGKVDHRNKLFSYTGYVDKSANEKKMVRDVNKKGDCYFNSGDILSMDDFGYFYFKDRTGDTFRWKGENVSTAEVEGILTSIIGLNDIVVYGVQIPNLEGRAGMAAIVDETNKIDLAALVPAMNKALPPFARPLFLRILPHMPLTTTFKIIKTDLFKEGFDIDKIKDPIYFLDPKSSKYVLLTRSIYEDIVENRLRL